MLRLTCPEYRDNVSLSWHISEQVPYGKPMLDTSSAKETPRERLVQTTYTNVPAIQHTFICTGRVSNIHPDVFKNTEVAKRSAYWL